MDKACFTFLTSLNHITNMRCRSCILSFNNNKTSFLLCKRLHKFDSRTDNSLILKCSHKNIDLTFFNHMSK